MPIVAWNSKNFEPRTQIVRLPGDDDVIQM